MARLLVPRLNIDLIVLAGDNGQALSFGPGHRSGTALPGYAGNSLISGHRDTHFEFLRHLQLNDEILVQTKRGEEVMYVVSSTAVISETSVVADITTPRQLTLITCYPFDAIVPGGPLRYVVYAQEKNFPGL